MKSVETYGRASLRCLLGTLFLVAAVLKLLTIESFELYIYSFKIFGFGLTAVLSRMLIAAEILMGLGLILKIRYKEVWRLTMLALTGFTIFIVYVLIFRNDSNCHCFGDLIRLNPAESLVKNVVSMILLLLVRNENDHIYKPQIKKWLFGLSISTAVILPFVLIPTDSIYNMIFSKDNTINALEFENLKNDRKDLQLLRLETENDSTVLTRDTLAVLDLSDDRYIVSFISAGCEFCRLGASKLSIIFENNNIDKQYLKFFVWGYDADIVEFMQTTNTFDCEYWFIHPKKSINITYGKFPTYIWLNNGNIISSGDLRDLSEDKILKFIAD